MKQLSIPSTGVGHKQFRFRHGWPFIYKYNYKDFMGIMFNILLIKLLWLNNQFNMSHVVFIQFKYIPMPLAVDHNIQNPQS
jgi:hypothetical protein